MLHPDFPKVVESRSVERALRQIQQLLDEVPDDAMPEDWRHARQASLDDLEAWLDDPMSLRDRG
jgi:hypothetical protein